MLTQDDLQAIGKIFENKFDSRLSRIEKKLSSFDKKTYLRFKSVDKKLNIIIDYFDHQDIDTRKRLNRIELHLALSPLNS